MLDNVNPICSRRLVIASATMLKALGSTSFENFLVEIGLASGNTIRGDTLADRATSLAHSVTMNMNALAPQGGAIAVEMVRRAAEVWFDGLEATFHASERHEFANALRENGPDAAIELRMFPKPYESITASPFPRRSQVAKLRDGVPHSAGNSVSVESKEVFVVHGHDQDAAQSVARFLEQLGLKPIILSEQPDRGQTIIEKFDVNASRASYAVILLTEDDVGAAAGTPQPASRARQNVIFELGYFVGKFGRERACLVRKGNPEIPSDLYGIVYTSMDTNDAWKGRLKNELIDAGFGCHITPAK